MDQVSVPGDMRVSGDARWQPPNFLLRSVKSTLRLEWPTGEALELPIHRLHSAIDLLAALARESNQCVDRGHFGPENLEEPRHHLAKRRNEAIACAPRSPSNKERGPSQVAIQGRGHDIKLRW